MDNFDVVRRIGEAWQAYDARGMTGNKASVIGFLEQTLQSAEVLHTVASGNKVAIPAIYIGIDKGGFGPGPLKLVRCGGWFPSGRMGPRGGSAPFAVRPTGRR